MMTRTIVKLAAGLLAAGLALAAVGAERAPLEDPGVLGVVFDEAQDLPGTLESVGRPLASGDLVKALDRGALVRLDNGRVLKLSSNSSALLEDGPAGDVTVTVLSGRVATVGEGGRPLVAGQRSRFTVSPTYRDAEEAEAQLLRLDLGNPADRESEPGRRGLARSQR
jgi:hypothetical protein